MARSTPLIVLGILALFALYVTQAVLLSAIMARHINVNYWLFLLAYIPSFVLAVCFFRNFSSGAEDDETVHYVWAISIFLYIVPFVIIVAVIFSTVVGNLSYPDDLGPNALRTMLCFAPASLILLLSTTISPEHWKFILTLSVSTALDLFDGIEMLEIILLKEKGSLKLNDGTEGAIIAFACINFIVSPLSLLRYKITGDTEGDVEVRNEVLSLIRASIQMLLINFPCLVIRIYVWVDQSYEASVFITKNVISLVVGMLEVGVLLECFKCGPDPPDQETPAQQNTSSIF